MPVGTVRGRYELDAPALKVLKDLQRQGVKTQAQMKSLGQEIDRVGGADDVKRLKAYNKQLGDVRREGKATQEAVRKNWQGMTRSVKKEAREQRRVVDELIAKYDELGAKRIKPTIDLGGVSEALAQVELLERKLQRLGSRRATPRVGIGGGFTGGGAGGGGAAPRRPAARPFGGGGGGQGLRSIGFGPLNFGSKGGIATIGAALPAIQSIIGATTALAGSLSGAALGAGAVGLAGGGALAAGIGTLVAVAKPATTALGNARKAQMKLTEAVADFGKNSDQARKAKRELDQAMNTAPRGTRQLLRDLDSLQAFWKRATKPGQESFIGLLQGGISAGRRIAPTAARVGNQVARRTQIEGTRLGRNLSGRTGRRFLQQGGGAFNENLGNARVAIQYGASSFTNVMQASRPFLRDTTRWIRAWTRGWDESTSNITRTRDRIRDMVEHFKAWRRLGGAAFRLVRDLFRSGAPEGRSMVGQLTKQLEVWDDWVKRNPAKVRDFFRRSVKSTIDLARAIGRITEALSNLATLLGPIFDRFSQIVALSGQLGLLTPGVGALAIGAVRGARGRGGSAGGGAGGGGGGGTNPALVAAGAGGFFGGARARVGAARGGASTYGIARSFGYGRVASGAAQAGALGAGGLSRAGGFAGSAARGAGKAFLPVAAIMAALDFASTEGGIGSRAQGALSGATLGLVPRPQSRAQRTDDAGKYADKRLGGLSEGRTIRETRGDIEFLNFSRGAVGNNDQSAKFNKDQVSQVRSELTEEIRVRRGMVRDLRAQRRDAVRGTAVRRAGELQEGFQRRSGRVGKERAFTTAIGQTREELGRLGPVGARALATSQLAWARQAAKGNKGMLAQFRKLEDDVIKRFGGMAGQVAFINGKILTGTKGEWGRIADAISSAARRGVSETSEEFGRLRSVAVGALQEMGYSRGQASGVFKGLNAKPGSASNRVAKADAAAGPSPTQLAATDRTGDGLGISGARSRMKRTGDGPGARGPGGSGGGVNLMGANAGLGGYASIGAGFGLRVTSGLRPGSITSSGNRSHHASGSAIDIAGAPASMMEFARYMSQNYGSGLDELIYTPLGRSQIKNGQHYVYGGQVAADHHDHVHVADRTPSGAAGGGRGGVGGALGAGGAAQALSLTARRSGLGGVPGALSTAASAGIARGMEAAINKRLGAGGGGGTPNAGGWTGGVMTFEQVARLAESVGLPGTAFAQIAKGESGFNPRAIGHDPGGTRGLGLWQITTKFNDDIIARFGGESAMLNPRTNAQAAKAIYDRQGIKAWYGTKYLTDPNAHFTGDGIGFAGAFRRGGSFVTEKGRGSMFLAGEGIGQEQVTVRPHRPKGRPALGVSRGGGGTAVHVAVSMGNVSVRETADIDKIAEKVGDKVARKLSDYMAGVTDEDLL